MKSLLLAITIAAPLAQGATVNVAITNFFGAGAFANPFLDDSGNTLMDGDLVEFGYFTVANGPAADGDAFGDFVAVDSVMLAIGIGSPAANAGFISTSAILDNDTDMSLPTGTPTLQFALRIYNAATVQDATFFNTVTSPNFQYTLSNASPPPFNDGINISALGGETELVWEGGAASAFSTRVAVPEPSTSLALLLGLGLAAGVRRRK